MVSPHLDVRLSLAALRNSPSRWSPVSSNLADRTSTVGTWPGSSTGCLSRQTVQLRGKLVWAGGRESDAVDLDGDVPDEREDEAVGAELASGIG